MSESVILSLLDIIIKVLPNAVSFIERLVGDGGTITADHVPQILSHMADISKISTDLPSSGSDAANSIDAVQSVGSESHAP